MVHVSQQVKKRHRVEAALGLVQLSLSFGVKIVVYLLRGLLPRFGKSEVSSRRSLDQLEPEVAQERIFVSALKLVSGGENVRDSVGGPVMIGKITKEALDRGWEPFWFLVAMLSITLAIINILPIPALDGGHLVFLIYEGIARKEPPLKFRMAVQQIGMVLILGLMVFLIVNDILKL